MEPFRAGDFCFFVLESYIVYILICMDGRGGVEFFCLGKLFCELKLG